MADVSLVLLGAAATFIATLLIERWKLTRASQAAALMVVRELEFHQNRLGLAMMADNHPDASYELRFPSPAWSAYSSALVAGAPMRYAEWILNWYAIMTVLGGVLSRQLGPQGPQVSGPDRTRLREALDEAHRAAQYLAAHRIFGRQTIQPRSPLFEQPAPGHDRS